MDIELLTDVKCGDAFLKAGKVVDKAELEAVYPGLCDQLLSGESAKIHKPKAVDGVDPELAVAREANDALRAEISELREKLEAAKNEPAVPEDERRRGGKKRQMVGE